MCRHLRCGLSAASTQHRRGIAPLLVQRRSLSIDALCPVISRLVSRRFSSCFRSSSSSVSFRHMRVPVQSSVRDLFGSQHHSRRPSCVRACVRECMRVCVRAYVRACVSACVRALVRACVCSCVCARECERAGVRACVRVRVRVFIPDRVFTCCSAHPLYSILIAFTSSRCSCHYVAAHVSAPCSIAGQIIVF